MVGISRLDKRFFGSGYQCGRKFVNEITKDYLKSMKQPETQHLTIGQAIDYMLKSEENVIEIDWRDDERLRHRIKDYQLQFIDPTLYHTWNKLKSIDFKNWTKIKKYIEEKKEKTLKEKLEDKEPFKYKDHWYRFNKNGAIIRKRGSKAVSLQTIQEILKEMGNE